MVDGAAVGVRFDIGKVNESSYGVACWKAFWRALAPETLAGCNLFEGDTAASIDGQENVYCIAVHYLDADVPSRIKAAIADDRALRRLCAVPPIVEGTACMREPLVQAGRIDFDGNLNGDAWNARAALVAIRSE